MPGRCWRGSLAGAWERSARGRVNHDDAGNRSGGIFGEPRDAATGGARRRCARTDAALEQQPGHQRFGIGICDRGFARCGFAGTRDERCEACIFFVAADYRLWARKSQDIYDSNVGGTKNLLEAARRAGIEQLIYTSTVATIAVDRPELPNESTEAKLAEMIGHYKRSKWMAEQEALKAAKEGLPVIVAMPTTPVGPWDWKPTPTGKIILDFLNGKMPGYVETGLNFVGVEE